MTYTKVRYSPTPQLGYNGDFYSLSTYHVAPLPKLDGLTLAEANMIAEFMNKLSNPRSIRCIENRVRTNNHKGIDRILLPRHRIPTLLDPSVEVDNLLLRVKQGAIVWDEQSILERLENEAI